MRIRVSSAIALAIGMFLVAGSAQAVQVFANGGFELNGGAGTANSATGWQGAASGYTISTDANSGSFSIQLASPATNAAIALQNSVEDGLNPPLPAGAIGTTPTFSFFAKGFAGTTGNILYALRYLDGVGNILADSGNVFFQADINPNTWTNITNSSVVVPVGATAAFLEISQAIGPINGDDLLAGLVLIDDVSLEVVPVPAAVWLFGSALGLLGFIRRKLA